MCRRALAASVPRLRVPNRPLCYLAGRKNGDLLEAAEAAAFDVLITVDQDIPDQQNMAGRKIAVLILCAPTNRLRDLRAVVPAALSALRGIQPGAVVRIR